MNLDKKVIFVTNNATKSRKGYKSKFDRLGIEVHIVSLRFSFFRLIFMMDRMRSMDRLMQQLSTSPQSYNCQRTKRFM